MLKEKLKEKGYFNGETDNIVTEELKASLIKFRVDNKMSPVFELDDGALYLLGLIDSFEPPIKHEVNTDFNPEHFYPPILHKTRKTKE